ncbi:MAG: MarR family transcriptional regulator [Caulobacteraceae bacterium]|nr:MarR family transcriptional regulator [Caulobacteraceae bacterium]
MDEHGQKPPLSPATPDGLEIDPAHYALHLLAAVSRFRDAALDKDFAPLGLTVTRYRALNAIVMFEPCTMGELADFSGVERTTMTRTVDQLVAADLIDRQPSATDRRQVILRPTAHGLEITAQARQIVREQNERIMEGVPEDALGVMIQAKSQMFANLAGDPLTIERMLTLRRREEDPLPA